MSVAALIRAGAPRPCTPYPRFLLGAPAWRGLIAALDLDREPALLALFADAAEVHALVADGADIVIASVAVQGGGFPALSPVRPVAAWFERAIHDLWGHGAEGGTDVRPWLDHGHWGQTQPMAPRPGPPGRSAEPPEFAAVEGDPVLSVPVGPIHAGIIEPGHFRFAAGGESVVRLEARLGYTHKGTLTLLRGRSPRAAARFAARLSGDATVAHGIAFAHAAEAASGVAAPPRAAALRAVMAELERIANHLLDVGAITADAGFAYAQARCGLVREGVLRAAATAFGHRLMMDAVVPGGVATDLAAEGAAAIADAVDTVAAELPSLTRIIDASASLGDRLVGTGITPPALVARLGAGGVVGRAAGRAADARVVPGYAPYPDLAPVIATSAEGDVDARVRVRLAELGESVRLVRALLAALPDGPVAATLPPADGEGIGCAELCRGDAWHWLRLEGGVIAEAFLCDPSWRLWPLVEAAALDAVIADFPLINRSISASYSGVDL